jgi:undecaprenyl-diphosphatase
MPLLALLLIAVVIGALVARLSLAVSRRHPGRTVAREIGTAVADRPELRRATRRVGSESVTGIALAVALAIVLCGGLVLAVLAFLVRSDTDLAHLDRSVAEWGQRHASPLTDQVLDAITFVGQPTSIGMLAALVALAETIRTRNRWIAPFMLLVIAGTGLLTTTVKELADRARPAFNPIAETLGPSFPSGHSSWSAAFLAATALISAETAVPTCAPHWQAPRPGLRCPSPRPACCSRCTGSATS